jgi:predicted DNA-binding protein with PD1-like motif
VQARQIDTHRWILVLDRGEEIVGTVTGFLEDHDIKGGFVTGLGALVNHTVGYYDLQAKEYLKRTFEEVMELGNLTGSIGTVDGKPFLHAHVTVSGPELIAFTGHLVKGEVGVTAELLLTAFHEELPRLPDEDVGLNLFRLVDEPAETPAEEAESGEEDE